MMMMKMMMILLMMMLIVMMMKMMMMMMMTMKMRMILLMMMLLMMMMKMMMMIMMMTFMCRKNLIPWTPSVHILYKNVNISRRRCSCVASNMCARSRRVTSAETHVHPCTQDVQVREQENASKTTLIPWTPSVHIL